MIYLQFAIDNFWRDNVACHSTDFGYWFERKGSTDEGELLVLVDLCCVVFVLNVVFGAVRSNVTLVPTLVLFFQTCVFTMSLFSTARWARAWAST